MNERGWLRKDNFKIDYWHYFITDTSLCGMLFKFSDSNQYLEDSMHFNENNCPKCGKILGEMKNDNGKENINSDGIHSFVKFVGNCADVIMNKNCYQKCYHQFKALYYGTNSGIEEAPYEMCFKCYMLKPVEDE